MAEQSMGSPAGPLTGIRVIEVGHFIAAPFAARLLADYGAEVVKVELPGSGDPIRSLGEHVNGQSLWWSSIARNKKCITLDLHKPQGQELFLSLVKQSDAIIENFRVGQLERWDLGWERIHAVNPQAVLVRVSGFGQTGPYRDRVAFAPIAEAFGGLRYLIRDPDAPEDRPPIRASLSLGDSIASLFAAVGLLTALLGRKNHGGTPVDVSMFESIFALLESAVSEYGVTGQVREPAGSAVPHLAPSNTYKCADGTWVCLTSTSDRLFQRLCAAMGKSDLATDPGYRTNEARSRNRKALDAIVASWVGSLAFVEVETKLLQASIPVSKIYSIRDCVADEHYQAREAVIEVNDPRQGVVLQPNIFPVFQTGGGRPRVNWPGPSLGAHNVEVLRDVLDLSEARIAELTQEGVI